MNRATLKIVLLLIALMAAMATGPTVVLAQQSPADNAGDSVVATLANGAGIEFLGLTETPVRPWWKADGSPLTAAPYRHLDSSVSPSAGTIVRYIALREKDTLKDSKDRAAIQWSVVSQEGIAEGSVGSGSSRMEGAAIGITDTPDGMTVHADIAAGAWTTQFTAEGKGQMSQAITGLFGLGSHSILWGTPVEDHGKTRLMVAMSGLGDDLDIRVVAIDQGGAEHPCGTSNGSNDGRTMIHYCNVALAPADIKQWKLETRAYDQWVEIRHISLHAGQASTVEIVTSDNPAAQ